MLAIAVLPALIALLLLLGTLRIVPGARRGGAGARGRTITPHFVPR